VKEKEMKAIMGVDVSKKKFDVALLEGEKVRRKVFVYDAQGPQALLAWLLKRGVAVAQCWVCMEATGSYYERLAEELDAAGVWVSVVNPLQIKRYGQSLLLRHKTDRTDAQLIARFCQQCQPQRWHAPAVEIRELQSLVARLESLIGMRTQELNRQHEVREAARASVERMLEALEVEIARVRKQIEEHIDRHPGLRQQSALLQSIPGVGEGLSSYVMAWLSVERFTDAKQAAAFVGVIPRHHESGSSVHGRSRLSTLGHRRLRRMLFMPAMSAMRCNEALRQFAERLRAAGKRQIVVVVAVMRKLVHLMFGVLKSGRPFDLTRALAKN
jgi:transposase